MRRNVSYDPDNDYYAVIGVAPNADIATIQKAYRTKAKELHPDVNQDRHEWAKERFQVLNEAYSVLTDAETRRIYDNLRWPYQFHSSQGNTRQSAQQHTSPQAETSWTYEERPYQQYYQSRPQQPFTQAPLHQQPQRAVWLDDLHLGWLKPTYLAFVNLIESPYRYILLFVGLLLAVNIVLVAAGVWQSSRNGSAQNNVVIVATNTLNGQPFSEPDTTANVIPTSTSAPSVTPLFVVMATLTLQPTATMTFTPQPSEMDCHPDITIDAPPNGQTIYRHSLPEEVQVIGRIAVPEMFAYSVEAHLIDVTSSPVEPIVLRGQSAEPEAPIENGTLATLDLLRYQDAGVYQVVIRVWDAQQVALGQCSFVVVKGQ